LALQMRRAAVSIPANIAEGFTRRGKTDKARFMNIAESSIEESRYYLILAQDLGYGNTAELMNVLEEVSRLLNAYARAILAPGSWLLTPISRAAGYQGAKPLAWLGVRDRGEPPRHGVPSLPRVARRRASPASAPATTWKAGPISSTSAYGNPRRRWLRRFRARAPVPRGVSRIGMAFIARNAASRRLAQGA